MHQLQTVSLQIGDLSNDARRDCSSRWLRTAANIVATLVVFSLFNTSPASAKETRPPNFVVVFTDDQGYQDVGVFGSPDIETPNLDRMAAEGARFTDFYVSQAVCSASRSALMTGCYNVRVGILGALGPQSKNGINDDEMTIAEVLKQKGYATAI